MNECITFKGLGCIVKTSWSQALCILCKCVITFFIIRLTDIMRGPNLILQ